jgi:hypothetical protein
MRALLLAFALLPLTACTVYFGGDDDADDDIGDDDCYYGADDEPEPIAPIRLLDPATLQCTDFGYDGCPDTCGGACEEVPPQPSWGYCESECSYLDEGTCLTTPRCRAVYDYSCYTGDGPCTAEVPYMGCFQTDFSGPVGGDCLELDAWSCSTRDDCVALHDFNFDGWFTQCRAEGVACEYIGSEDECLAREDCSPRYVGTDCTCDPSGNCTCNTWTFQDCITGRDPGDDGDDPAVPPM